MSSSSQLKKLIETYGFEEIQNDLQWLKELEKKKCIIKTRIHNIEWSGEDWDGLTEEVSIDLPIEMGVTDFGIKRTHKIIKRFVEELYQRKIINSSLDWGRKTIK